MYRWFKKHFIPHAGNNHHPHIWKEKAVTFILVFLFVVEMTMILQPILVFRSKNFLSAVLPGVVIALTNKERVGNNEPELIQNPILTEAARLKAEDMATRGYFSHNTPEGLLPWYWVEKAGYKYVRAGENLAVNFTDSKDVVEAWMKSPTHKANIIKESYTEIGVAMAEGVYEGRRTIFVVQFFGTPMTAVAEQPVAKATTKLPVASAKAKLATTSISTVTKVAGAELETQSPVKVGKLDVLEASPVNTGRYILLCLFILILLSLLATLYSPIKTHHTKILVIAVLIIIIILNVLYFNKNVIENRLRIAESQSSGEVGALFLKTTI